MTAPAGIALGPYRSMVDERIVKSDSRKRQYCAPKCTLDPPTQFAIPTVGGELVVGVFVSGRHVGISRLNFGPPRLLRLKHPSPSSSNRSRKSFASSRGPASTPTTSKPAWVSTYEAIPPA